MNLRPDPSEDSPRQTVAAANRQFPVPPFYYKAFTDQAWSAHNASSSKSEDTGDEARDRSQDPKKGTNIFSLGDRDEILTRTEDLFTPPNVNWIAEDGYWEAFGQANALAPKPISEIELNLPTYRPPDQDLSDKQYLHLLLRSMLHTKLQLVTALTKTLRPVDRFQRETEHLWRDGGHMWSNEGEPYARHMHTLALAMILVTNSLRDAQGRLTLEAMMQAQLDRRKAQTQELKNKCTALAEQLRALKAKST